MPVTETTKKSEMNIAYLNMVTAMVPCDIDKIVAAAASAAGGAINHASDRKEAEIDCVDRL
jgi:hypothetical protein